VQDRTKSLCGRFDLTEEESKALYGWTAGMGNHAAI
jgi:hypothetical protein